MDGLSSSADERAEGRDDSPAHLVISGKFDEEGYRIEPLNELRIKSRRNWIWN